MAEPFLAKLRAAAEQNHSLVCVGLDPDPSLMPIEDVAEFTKTIVDATADLVCAYKPNLAFYEALGDEGWDALKQTLAVIPPEIPVIADAKRGDIGNTSAAYARAIFDVLGCDAMTVNAYGGKDAVEPFLEYADKGVIILCRMSNPSAIDFQDLVVEDRGQKYPLWQAVALKAREWNTRGNVGIVMGATYPAQLKLAREICPDMPILVPGIGAQEGSLREAVVAGLDADNGGIIVNASRSVLYASRGDDYGMAARSAAIQLRDHIERYREERKIASEA
ncbi:MAG TPA: orotidine-5'-phosphate decarboxylase [Dehalococcoidia bacterium]|nr:orotidine-5'-phosphate decarboxylase [Dehalococcoidia bacterium]